MSEQIYVYFAMSEKTGLIKIGVTSQPSIRIATLNQSEQSQHTILKVIEGNRQLESELHKRFSDIHVKGEWFTPSESLLDYIEYAKGVEFLSFSEARAKTGIISAQLYPETRHRLDKIAAALRELGYTSNDRKITKIIDDASTLYLRKLERQLRRKDKQS